MNRGGDGAKVEGERETKHPPFCEHGQQEHMIAVGLQEVGIA